jgi:hypothetical protein
MDEDYINEHLGDLKSFYNTSYESIKNFLNQYKNKEVFYLIQNIDITKPYKITMFYDKKDKDNTIIYITESEFTF